MNPLRNVERLGFPCFLYVIKNAPLWSEPVNFNIFLYKSKSTERTCDPLCQYFYHCYRFSVHFIASTSNRYFGNICNRITQFNQSIIPITRGSIIELLSMHVEQVIQVQDWKAARCVHRWNDIVTWSLYPANTKSTMKTNRVALILPGLANLWILYVFDCYYSGRFKLNIYLLQIFFPLYTKRIDIERACTRCAWNLERELFRWHHVGLKWLLYKKIGPCLSFCLSSLFLSSLRGS